MDYTIEIRRSKRKTLGLEIREKGVVIVRAPYSISNEMLKRELESHKQWIEKHIEAFQEEEYVNVTKYTKEELEQMLEIALEIIPAKVKRYAEQLGVSYGKITIRNQKTRWGSCSAKGNLNFNCLLTQFPENVMDYVIVHELCHRMEMNHSPRFWALVEKVMPNYREMKEWLKINGNKFIVRL